MVIERLAGTCGTLELWHASRWILRPEGFEEDGIPEPEASATKLHTFASRMSVSFLLQSWQKIAGEIAGPGELMVLDERGRGIAGPYPVLAMHAQAQAAC